MSWENSLQNQLGASTILLEPIRFIFSFLIENLFN